MPAVQPCALLLVVSPEWQVEAVSANVALVADAPDALDGMSRAEAATRAGLDRQALRDWVIRYHAEGVAGLRDRPRSGRRSFLDPAQREELLPWR